MTIAGQASATLGVGAELADATGIFFDTIGSGGIIVVGTCGAFSRVSMFTAMTLFDMPFSPSKSADPL